MSALGEAPAPTLRSERDNSRLALRVEGGRKFLHLASAFFPIAWGLGIASGEQVRAALAVAFGVALLVELLRRFSRHARAAFERAVGPLLRPHETHALTGATWLAGAMLTASIALPEQAAIAALWAAAAGDASAALVGRLIVISRQTPSNEKTWAGSLACLLATATGVWWLTTVTAFYSLAIGAAAAAAERPRLSLDDNVRVAFAAGLAAWAIGAG